MENYQKDKWQRLYEGFLAFFINIGVGIYNFFKKLPGRVYRFCKYAGLGIKNYFVRFYRGNIKTKLSYVIFGSGCFLNRQVVKGLIFLSLQAAYVLFMVFFGGFYLSKFGTLGTMLDHDVFDPEQGINITVQGDNSMIILLFGSVTLALTILFFFFYIYTTKAAYKNEILIKEGEKPLSFKEEYKNLFNKNYASTILSLPILGVFIFSILPLFFTGLIAFTNFNKEHPVPSTLFTWVGFDNFKQLLWLNKQIAGTLWSLLGWTLVWAFFATFLNYFLGMFLAMMINKKGIRLKKMWRTIFVITIAVPQFVSLMVMRTFLAEWGPVNYLLINSGIIERGANINFLNNSMHPNFTRMMVILVNCWIGIPYSMLITTGILMNIPADLYESAKIDGASPIVQYLKITLPYILFVTAPYLITQFVGNLNNFNVIFLLTGGGPVNTEYFNAGKTDLLVTWLYNLSMGDAEKYDLASAIGIIIFIISATFSLLVYGQTSAIKKEDGFN